MSFNFGPLLALLMVCAGLLGWGNYERAERVQAESELRAVTAALDASKQTVALMEAWNERQAESLAKYEKRERDIEQQTQQQSLELQRLRATESESALAAPFARGNAATDRRAEYRLRFMGPGGGSQNDPGNPEAGNSR